LQIVAAALGKYGFGQLRAFREILRGCRFEHVLEAAAA
jgi:hypothetical protein